jgi:hypothetical protein
VACECDVRTVRGEGLVSGVADGAILRRPAWEEIMSSLAILNRGIMGLNLQLCRRRVPFCGVQRGVQIHHPLCAPKKTFL